ncbi:MAG: phosphatase PAP2 family protein [Chthoniobacteraceae bacterium]
MDQKLLFLINRQWTCAGLDWFMGALSCFAAWVPLLVFLFLLLFLKGGFKVRAFLITAALIVGINDGVVSKTLKRLVDRPRPHQTVNDVRIVDLAKASPRVLALLKPAKVKLSRVGSENVEGRSFPSSHTMNCFSVALVALCFFGRPAAWGFLLAAFVGYSRIYTGSHWPSDVVTSVFLAFGSTLMLMALAERLWQRAGRRLLPQMHALHPSLLAT